MSGLTFTDAIAQPAATRAVMIRIPAARAARLESSNRYLDRAETLSSDLVALGLPVAAPPSKRSWRPTGRTATSRWAAADYSRLTLAIDCLLIENDLAPGVRPFPVWARRSSQDAVRLVQGLVLCLILAITAGLERGLQISATSPL